FGATITFVSNIPGETQTISAAIYTLTQVPGGDAAAGRLVLVAIAISLAALVVAEWLARRAGTRLHGGGACPRATWRNGRAISRLRPASRPQAASPRCSGPRARARPRSST